MSDSESRKAFEWRLRQILVDESDGEVHSRGEKSNHKREY